MQVIVTIEAHPPSDLKDIDNIESFEPATLAYQNP